MASSAIASASGSTRSERNRDAERRLWQHYGLAPGERFLDLEAPAARLRVLEVGSGEPVCAIVEGKSYRPGLTFADAELAAIRQPTLHVYGTADAVGNVDTWKRVGGVLPHGELRLVDGAGHMPWFDDSTGVAEDVGRFLTA